MRDKTTVPLVTAKTHLPPRRSELLRRPRLLDYLYKHIDKQLFLITAPAGYGKTSLLLDLAHDADFSVAWYALDEFDNAPRTFLEYLLAAIQVPFPHFGRPVAAALERASDSFESLKVVVGILANEMYSLPDHLIVVLDDYHFIQNETIDQLVALLIHYAGDNLHLFIDSRTLPRIPDQILLLARGQMDGLSVNELKFAAPEIQALIQQNYDLTVSETRAQELAQVTDGWITALLLMAHKTGWRQLVEGVVAAPEAAGRVYDYLAEQVFEKQPADIRHFLLGSSVLVPLEPELLERLPGLTNVRQHLQTLEAQQLFLSQLGGSEGLFAYHPLFGDFLKARLRREDPRWYEQLTLTCARLYTERAQWERAVEAYLSLGLLGQAIMVLEKAEESLKLPFQIASITRWVDALPHSVTSTRPRLMSLEAKIHRSRGEFEQAIAASDYAATLYMQAANPLAAAEQLELKAVMLRVLGRHRECIAETGRIDALLLALPESETVRMRAASLHARGTSEYYSGDLPSAFLHLTRARELFASTDDLIRLANVNHDLGMASRASGRLAEALQYYSEALRIWQTLGDPSAAANTLNNLGYVYYVQGEMEQAEEVLRDALARSREAGTRRIEALVLGTLGELQRDQGDYPKAMEFFGDSLRAAQETHDRSTAFYSLLGTAECYRLLGDWGRSREWLRSAEQNARASDSPAEAAQLKLAQGLLARDQAQLDIAVSLIAAAIKLAQKAGDKQHEALAEFHWAHVLCLQGRNPEAEPHLVRTAELLESLGYDHFLVVEGSRTELTLRFACTLSQVGPRFQKILERVHPALPHLLPETPVKPDRPLLSVYTLGQERFTLNGSEVNQLRPQVRELFLFLLTRYPQGARRDELWELLWPDLSSERADGVLRITVARIRKALCPVTFTNGWYSLTLERLWYDAHEFDSRLAYANRATSARAKIPRLLQALEVYKGNYLERLEQNWVIVERERLFKTHIGALLALAEAYIEVGELAAALNTYEKTSAIEPYLEAAWQGGMQTHLRMGNRAAALGLYERLKELLRNDMGIEPSPQVQDLYEKMVKMSI